MFGYGTAENISNIITYNYYYGLFLTKVEKKTELLDENIESNDFADSEKNKPKSLYELTLIPALICLSIFLIMFLLLYFLLYEIYYFCDIS